MIRVFASVWMVVGLILSAAAQFTPETVLATSTAGEVTFADIEEDWPHLGSDRDKLALVRATLKEMVYTREAENEKLTERPAVRAMIEEARLSAYLEALFLRQIGEPEIPLEEVRRNYEANRSLYFFDEHLYLRHISVDIPKPNDPASRVEAKMRAIEALGRLKSGEDFAKVSEEYSSDRIYGANRIGPVPIKEVPASWGDEVARLQKWQLSNVIELSDHFEIVQVIDRIPAGYQSFEQVRPSIEARLRRERRREAQVTFLTDILNNIRASIDHRAIADPKTKGNQVVIRSDQIRLRKDEYDQWAAQQSAMTRRALVDPVKREAIIRKDLLLRHWIEAEARKEKLDSDPVFQSIFNRQRRALLAAEFENYLFSQNPSFLEVTDADIQEYYANYMKEFEAPERAEIRDVIFKVEEDLGGSPEARALAFRFAEQLADGVLKQIREHTILFEMAAVQHGSSFEPGAYFQVSRGTYGEPFDDVVFQLRPGELAPRPVRTDEGYRIVQMGQIFPPVQLPLSEVRGRIARMLENQKRDQLQQRLEDLYFQKYQANILEEVVLKES